MSFIEQQREIAITENNTAQAYFLNFLDNLNPDIDDIIIREPLSGDLDFDVLKKCNFTNIVSLQFAPGRITSMKNIPPDITRIVCAENYLVELTDLPDSLIELDVRHNAIKNFDKKLPDTIKELNISENLFTSLENLPKWLEVLKCSNNQLRTLDLDGIDGLRILECSNNPLLVIQHFPDTIQHVEMDNDVVTNINSLRGEGEIVDEDDDTAERRADYIECLHTYFELKREYEERINKMKHNIFARSVTKKAARMKMKDLKPKCIYCSRPVGSIFKKEERTYIATCGDIQNPCPFQIRLFTGEYNKVNEMVNNYKNIIEFAKEFIIADKLKVLFNYISEADGVEIFKENLDMYTKENMQFTALKKEYETIYFNEERSEKIKQKMVKIKGIQERIGELYDLYKIDNNPEVLKDAMTIYVSELIPEMENLQIIKYDIREMIYNENTDVSKLFQTSWRVNQIEYTFGEYPKVLKFRTKK